MEKGERGEEPEAKANARRLTPNVQLRKRAKRQGKTTGRKKNIEHRTSNAEHRMQRRQSVEDVKR
jgi:hypothetical protein